MNGRALALSILALVVSGCASAATTLSSSPTATTAPPSSAPPAASPSTGPTATPPESADPVERFPVELYPEPPEGPLDSSDAGKLQAVLDALVGKLSGVAITGAVIVGDSGVWSGVAGEDDGGTPITTDVRFSTGSIGKTVVAAQVMRLAEQGTLSLGDRAADHIPSSLGLDTNGATVRDLLGMRSGLTGHFPPGKSFVYSNHDYVLLGYVIEAVTARPLGVVLTDDILAVPGAAGLTFPADGSVVNAAGPLDSDAMSLARWGYELFGGRLLSTDSLAAMTDFSGGEYGMGVFDFSVDFDRPAAGHLGIYATWSAGLVAVPDRSMVIAALMDSADVERTYGVLVDLARVIEP